MYICVDVCLFGKSDKKFAIKDLRVAYSSRKALAVKNMYIYIGNAFDGQSIGIGLLCRRHRFRALEIQSNRGSHEKLFGTEIQKK